MHAEGWCTAWWVGTVGYYTPSDSSRAATIFQFCGAGNLACSRLLGGSWLRLCCSVGQTIGLGRLSGARPLARQTTKPDGLSHAMFGREPAKRHTPMQSARI